MIQRKLSGVDGWGNDSEKTKGYDSEKTKGTQAANETEQFSRLSFNNQ